VIEHEPVRASAKEGSLLILIAGIALVDWDF
jgi:hypothetical protein